MPAPVATQTQESVRTEAHYLSTLHQGVIAATAYAKVDTFNIPGYGAMPSFEWVCPTGDSFLYEQGSGELRLSGTPYSSMGSGEKEIFFRWLNHFVHKCMVKYNKEYGL
jgi:hypothetical protein